MPTRPKQFSPFPVKRRDGRKAERDAFYSGSRWMRLRAAYLVAHPVCERCLAQGQVVPATIAHHKAERLARPDLALAAENLEALCSSCHSKHHHRKRG